jgi:hypothetical protein
MVQSGTNATSREFDVSIPQTFNNTDARIVVFRKERP